MDNGILKPKAWNWHEPHGFVWGRVVPTGARTIYVAGQTSIDEEGLPLYKGDMGAQLARSVENLQTVLAEAGATLAHVVKVTYFTVDVDLFFAHMDVLVRRLEQAGCKPTSTLVEVRRLFHPDILFEVESVAVV
jgi:enamine deaminase RidA (YjgF/YER057c/UK114 family)